MTGYVLSRADELDQTGEHEEERPASSVEAADVPRRALQPLCAVPARIRGRHRRAYTNELLNGNRRELLRARLCPADALMVSVLAYAGLRPQELLALQWNDIHERAILVRRKNVDGQLYPYTKTRQNRQVKLLAPLATDLAEWKLASGRRGHDLVVPVTISSSRTRMGSRGRGTSTSTGAPRVQAARLRDRADLRRAVRPARIVRVVAGVGGPDDA